MADIGVSKFDKECFPCCVLLKFSYKYCPQCGVEKGGNNKGQEFDERAVISTYFRKGHKYSQIVELLQREQNVTMSI